MAFTFSGVIRMTNCLFLWLLHDDPDLKRCNEEFPFTKVKQLQHIEYLTRGPMLDVQGVKPWVFQ